MSKGLLKKYYWHAQKILLRYYQNLEARKVLFVYFKMKMLSELKIDKKLKIVDTPSRDYNIELSKFDLIV